jgi:hypothetical protein
MPTKKGRRKYSNRKILNAIKGSGGIKTTIAKRLKCDWNTVHNYVTTVPELMVAYNDECESITDMAATVLVRSIQSGNATDAKWYLERRRKDLFSLRREIAIEKSAIDDMTDEELDTFIDGIG